jgi:hypothetical protein
MKNSAKKILSLLLAVVMMSSLATFALAVTAGNFEVSTASSKATYNNTTNQYDVYFTAADNAVDFTAAPIGFAANEIVWSTGTKDIVGLDAAGTLQYEAATATNTLYCRGAGTSVITLQYVDLTNGTKTGTFTINAIPDTVKAVTITNASPVSLGVKDTAVLTSTVTYDHCAAGTAASYTSGNTAIATVTDAGVVTGVAVGTTTITASAGGKTSDPITVNVTPSLSVSPKTSDVDEGNTTALTAALSGGTGAYTYEWSSSNTNVTVTPTGSTAKVGTADISDMQTAVITCTALDGTTVIDTDTCTVTAYPKADKIDIKDGSSVVTNTTVPMTSTVKTFACSTDPAAARGAAAWSSGDASIATVDAKTGVVTATGKTGTADIICTYTNKDNSVKTAKCTISVVTQTKAASNVSMSATNNVSTQMTAAHDGIYNAYYSAYGSYPTSGATITFNSIPRTNGSLYASSTQTTGNTVTTGKAYDFAAMSNMTYLPNKVGTETITYTLTSAGTDTATMNYLTGTLYIAVTSSNGTVTVNLDGSDPYVFSYSTAHDGQSAASSIYSSIMSSTGKAYSYLTFDAAPSSAVGTLYSSASGSAAAANAPFYYSGTSPLVSNLYFVPANSGTYSRTFKAYDGSGTLIFSGTLQIVVPTKPAAGDVSYSTAVSSSLMMDEADFISWYKAQTGSGYYLSSVTFDSAKYSNPSYPGYFQHNGKTFSPGNGVSYYTQSYNGTANSGGTYLNKVTYNSPIVTCNITVKFTCYGGTSKNSTYLARSGVMYICVNQNAPANIRYTVSRNAGMTLVPADFSNVYANVMNTSSAGSFYVTFLNAPDLGTMSVGYVNASRPGVTLTDANAASYSFYVNYSSGVYTIDDVTYTPGNYTGNSDTVKYAAYSINGQLLYIGEVDFVYGATSGTTCYSDGYNFTSGDFFKSSDTDPVYYVTFGQPSSGVLYYNYAHGSGTIVPKTVKFYTKYLSYGSYSVTAVEYIPAMGYSGTVSIPYTAYKSSGSSSTGSFTLSVVSKTNSTVFGDVTAANTGSWSANSVDFAYFWGLVTGSGAGTFSPRANMTRGQLVTILYNAAGSPAVSGTVPFSDVRYSDYYYSAVLWAYRNGIVGGRTSASFAPGANITREDFCVILYKYAAYTGRDTSYGGSLYGFSDAGSVSAYARTAMQWAVYHGYISGTNSYTLSPKGYASRAQVAVMLHSFLTKQ